MNIAALCQRQIITVDADASLADAARLMRAHHVGALVVTGSAPDGLQVVGIITDRDLVIDALARGLDTQGVAIGELASAQVASVFEGVPIDSAIQAMQQEGVRRLLVVDAERRLTGIVSLDDLMPALAASMAGLADVIRSGIDREARESAPLPAPAIPVLRIPSMGTAAWGNPST